MRRSKRPILVIWPPGLWTLICVVSQFVTVVTCDLISIPLLLFFSFLVSDLSRIDSGGRDGRIPLVLMLLLLFVFPSLIGRFGLQDRSRGLRSFDVLPAVHRSLSFNFVRGDVSGSTSLEDLYISLSHVKIQL